MVDSHIHVLLLCDRASAGELARRVALAIHAAIEPGAPFEPCRCRPFTDAAHLRNAFEYVLRQNARHGVGSDPRHDGSVLPDLLGLRVGGLPIALRVREHLPRLTREDLLAHLGVGRLDAVEGIAPGLEAELVEAAAAAFALPDLSGSSRDVLDARAAAIAAVPDTACATLAAALGVSARSVQRARLLSPPPAHVRAVRLQLGLALALGRPLLKEGLDAPDVWESPRHLEGETARPVAEMTRIGGRTRHPGGETGHLGPEMTRSGP